MKEYPHEELKIEMVESWQELPFLPSGLDVEPSDLKPQAYFYAKKRFRGEYVQRSISLDGGFQLTSNPIFIASIAADNAQYVIPLTDWSWFLWKTKEEDKS